MKKNYPMRVGALLLALTLVTSCFVGGTFAKYVTSDKGTDSARVAKFGVTVTGVGEEANTMFAKKYDADDPSYPSEGGADGNVTVSSDVKVVAPGTKGDMAAFTITGTPEVAVKVTYEATEFELGENWKDKDNNYYCPLEIKVGTDTLKGLDYTSADLFETAVKEKIAAYSKTYAPKTDLNTKNSADKLTISWEWPFEAGTGNTDNPDSEAVAAEALDASTPGVQTDEKDTYLGDQAANNTNAEIKLTVTATVTQID